jgi:hypothetical protein
MLASLNDIPYSTRVFFFLISQKDFIKKRKAPQKYIRYIQEELLTRKRKRGKKIRITKRQRGQVSRSTRVMEIEREENP